MDAREWFSTAAGGVREVVAGIAAPRLDDPALGEWDLRALLGHTSRAFSTIETYLAAPGEGDVLADAGAYFRASAQGLADPAAVTERGRAAGAALGADPLDAFAEIAGRVVALVAATPDDAPVGTPVGPMSLIAYLPTRAFELTVHGLDLTRATDQVAPAALVAAAPPALELVGRLAPPEAQTRVLLALTGREPLPSDFSLT